MPADEVTRGTDVDGSRARTGPRHAAPRKPLFTRFHMPAGKAIASVAMPTAVLMGMGFTSSLALADNNGTPSPSTSAKSLTADEYKDCVKALDDSKDPSASPSPSASQSTSEEPATPAPSASDDGKGTPDAGDTGGSSSSDSGSDSGSGSGPDAGSGDKTAPEPTATSGSDSSGSDPGSADQGSAPGGETATPTPSQTQGGGGVLDTIGDTLGDILTGGHKDSGTSTATPTPSASESSSPASSSGSSGSGSSSDAGSGSSSSGGGVSDTVEDTAKKATDTVKDTTDTVSKTAGTVSKTAGDAAKTEGDAAKTAGDTAGTATPDPSASESASAEDCPVATEDEGGVDNKVPVADDPWYLNASSLLLKGADYQGIVEVKTANGTKKKVLKYVISGGTDIGDLHQTVNDKQANKTYHVQASKGSTSTITGGDTVMYTESISGNLFGLIPVTFSPDSPPPLNIPLIYFTHVKVVQAAQFGGNLHVPGMHVYTTD
ncbi:hypothetical protein [Streptomyces sp. Caat 7-52]|uniref:hypothetical protein n=1 Tax=Streptomyces sp. Caat 7-52 TaxID=2949637 RepID=UPI002034AB76|nr:hypothetical protein [Streptomyces sp. Caat 7-52]